MIEEQVTRAVHLGITTDIVILQEVFAQSWRTIVELMNVTTIAEAAALVCKDFPRQMQASEINHSVLHLIIQQDG